MDNERRFRIIWISQSDGTLEWRNPKTMKMEMNAPPKTKLLNSHRGEMGYEELQFHDKRHKEWRKKLGSLLVQDEVDRRKASSKDPGDLGSTKYILGALPDKYKLYEGTRHEGTKLRKEVFVYGHPEGPKKRYRAAREFVPHLAWLCNDDHMDPRNCECKFCAPPDAQRAFEEMTQYQVRRFGIKVPDEKPIKISQQVGTKIENQQSLVPPRESNSITNTSKASDQSKDIPRLLTTSSPQMTKQQLQEANQVQKQTQPQRRTSITATTSQRPAIAPNQKPTPPVPHLNPDQKLDFMPQKFMFRQGEAIWFARDDGQGPFGLGVVVYREMVPKSPGLEKPRYKVQPLSHPFSHPEAEIIREEVWLKPWLAFSPPDPFHESLRNIDTPYYRLPWKDILEGKWGVGDAEVDGSIFAARTVDGTYTVFEPLPIKEMGKSYNGVFFGGEKVWRGEAVRLAGASREGQILIISDILEVTPAPGQPAELIFVGDVYVWKRLRPEDKSPPPNNFLPQLVNLDLNFRNEVARAAKKSIHIWHFIESRARFSWEDLKGRWYPSRYLVPSLCGSEEFQQQITLGDVIDAGSKINSQGDYAPSEGGIKVISKKDTRAAAFGGSIPSGKLDFGISQKQYTTIIGASVPSANTKSVNMNTQLGAAPRPSYTPKQQSQAQALHQQFQHLTPLQRQQLEQQQVQARQALQQQQAHHQRTPMRQAIDTVMPDARAPSNEDPMDMDFHQFIN